MFRPEEQQIEICLLKSNLEEIENDLVIQRSALPALDAENEQKYRETMTALRVTRSLNVEIERLKLENVRLTAKRMQLKRQSDDVAKSLQTAREHRINLTELLHQEQREAELEIRQYEDSLADVAERFRSTRGFYNEEEINGETEKVNTVIAGLEDELGKRQSMVDELKLKLEMLQPVIPEDLPTVMGRKDLEAKMKALTEKCDALVKKRNMILKKKNDVTVLKFFKGNL